jgi:hypothetical protein
MWYSSGACMESASTVILIRKKRGSYYSMPLWTDGRMGLVLRFMCLSQNNVFTMDT